MNKYFLFLMLEQIFVENDNKKKTIYIFLIEKEMIFETKTNNDHLHLKFHLFRFSLYKYKIQSGNNTIK